MLQPCSPCSQTTMHTAPATFAMTSLCRPADHAHATRQHMADQHASSGGGQPQPPGASCTEPTAATAAAAATAAPARDAVFAARFSRPVVRTSQVRFRLCAFWRCHSGSIEPSKAQHRWIFKQGCCSCRGGQAIQGGAADVPVPPSRDIGDFDGVCGARRSHANADGAVACVQLSLVSTRQYQPTSHNIPADGHQLKLSFTVTTAPELCWPAVHRLNSAPVLHPSGACMLQGNARLSWWPPSWSRIGQNWHGQLPEWLCAMCACCLSAAGSQVQSFCAPVQVSCSNKQLNSSPQEAQAVCTVAQTTIPTCKQPQLVRSTCSSAGSSGSRST